MQHYRIYGLNTAGHFAWAVDAVCANDEAACNIAARTHRLEREREVWRGTTRVALIIGQASPAKQGWVNEARPTAAASLP
jgi:hypothetical protein